MNLMLAVLVVCVAVGLLVQRWEPRTYWWLGGIVSVMTGLYYFTTRFMT